MRWEKNETSFTSNRGILFEFCTIFFAELLKACGNKCQRSGIVFFLYSKHILKDNWARILLLNLLYDRKQIVRLEAESLKSEEAMDWLRAGANGVGNHDGTGKRVHNDTRYSLDEGRVDSGGLGDNVIVSVPDTDGQDMLDGDDQALETHNDVDQLREMEDLKSWERLPKIKVTINDKFFNKRRRENFLCRLQKEIPTFKEREELRNNKSNIARPNNVCIRDTGEMPLLNSQPTTPVGINGPQEEMTPVGDDHFFPNFNINEETQFRDHDSQEEPDDDHLLVPGYNDGEDSYTGYAGLGEDDLSLLQGNDISPMDIGIETMTQLPANNLNTVQVPINRNNVYRPHDNTNIQVVQVHRPHDTEATTPSHLAMNNTRETTYLNTITPGVPVKKIDWSTFELPSHVNQPHALTITARLPSSDVSSADMNRSDSGYGLTSGSEKGNFECSSFSPPGSNRGCNSLTDSNRGIGLLTSSSLPDSERGNNSSSLSRGDNCVFSSMSPSSEMSGPFSDDNSDQQITCVKAHLDSSVLTGAQTS